MDEDEAKSIASDWIRQLEVSLLAKVSDNHDTIPADHIYPSYHQEYFVSSSFSHDDLEKKHVDFEKTSSDEKIHHEATGLQDGKEISFQEVAISKTKFPNDHIPKIATSLSSNALSSPRIDLEDLRRKRLQRFENLINPKARDFEEKHLSLEETYFTESVSEENMLHCNVSSLSKEEKTLRNSSKDKWKVKPCSYEAIRTISDEEDKLRLELWGLRGAVESGRLDIDSYLGPLFSRSKNSDAYNLKNAFKEDRNSAHLKTFDNTSGTQHCSSSRDANFNFKKLDPNLDSVSKKCHKERKALEGNTSSVKSATSHRSLINEIETTCQSGSISKEDFTRFSITKSKINPSCGSGTSSWQQIEGNLYNGFETSDSESCTSVPCIHISHQSKSKAFQVKSDFTKPTDLQPLKSGKGKQKILNELTEFLVSEQDSTRASKDFIKRSPKSSSEPKCVESLVFSGEHMSDFQFLENLENSSLSDSDIRSSTTLTHKDCLSSNSNAIELNETYSLSNNRSLELSSILSQEKYRESSDVQVEDRCPSSRTEMAKVCKCCQEVNSKAANWCIECGTALIKVEPVPLSSEQLSKYEKQCQMTRCLIAEALKFDKPSLNGSPAMSKTEKDLVQDVLHLSKEVAKNDGFSSESLRSNLSNYKRRWLKSSIAWSSYEPLELSKPSSILKGNGKEMNKLKGNKNFQSQSSNDLSAEGLQKKHANKNGFSRSGGRHRTNSGNEHCADDHDSRCALSINLEMHCSQEKVRPGSAKARGKSQRAKPHKKRPSSSKSINYSPSSSPDLLATTNGSKTGGNLVHIPQLNLDDLGSYDRILTLIRSQRDCEPVPYLCLPEEIILQIFSYLSIKDKVSCAHVCWQFYRIAMDETLWKTIIIRKNKHINDNWLESIGDRHPSSLTLSQCSGNNVTSNGLRNLFRKCAGSLKEVNMSGCGGELIGESILLHISARCSGVVSVDVSWTNVSDNGVEALAENLTRLECLCLNGCQAITDKSLNCVANKHGESLRIFEVFGCFNITPASLQSFANKCIHLQTLNIGQCHKMTDNAIGNLVTHLCELENLDLRGCKQARDSAVNKIARHCPHLTSLVLANCPLITDVALSDISANLPGIKSLDICGCANITDAGVRALARCCHKLELLDLSSTGNSVTSKSVVSLGNYCSQSLRVLKLSFCADITAHTVNQLAKNCKKLRLLHLYGCKRIREHDKLKNTNPLLVIEK